MRKEKLIELLQNIPGNPNILLWNGFVNDWTDIDKELVPVQMGKETVEFLYNAILREKLELGVAPSEELSKLAMARAKELHKKRPSDVLNPYVDDEDVKKWYGNSVRTAYFINAKSRNKSTFGFGGSSMSY